MREIIDYEIILEDGLKEGLKPLEDEVKKRIKEGWEPLGAPFECGKDRSFMAQAVVKYSEK